MHILYIKEILNEGVGSQKQMNEEISTTEDIFTGIYAFYLGQQEITQKTGDVDT